MQNLLALRLGWFGLAIAITVAVVVGHPAPAEAACYYGPAGGGQLHGVYPGDYVTAIDSNVARIAYTMNTGAGFTASLVASGDCGIAADGKMEGSIGIGFVIPSGQFPVSVHIGGARAILNYTADTKTPAPKTTPPTVHLSAAGEHPSFSTQTGNVVPLGWSTTDATTCTASDGWSGSKATSGGQNSSALTKAGVTKFTLTCTGTGGSATDSVTVTVTPPPPPTAKLTVNGSHTPAVVIAGSTVPIQWSSTSADNCSIGSESAAIPSLKTIKEAAGSTSIVAPSDVTSVKFSLVCRSAGGTANATDTVTLLITSHYVLSGSYTTAPLTIPTGWHLSRLSLTNETVPSGTAITYQLLDASGQPQIWSSVVQPLVTNGVRASSIDLSPLPGVGAIQQVRIKIQLATNQDTIAPGVTSLHLVLTPNEASTIANWGAAQSSLQLGTDKTSYTTVEPIHVVLKNPTGAAVTKTIGSGCGTTQARPASFLASAFIGTAVAANSTCACPTADFSIVQGSTTVTSGGAWPTTLCSGNKLTLAAGTSVELGVWDQSGTTNGAPGSYTLTTPAGPSVGVTITANQTKLTNGYLLATDKATYAPTDPVKIWYTVPDLTTAANLKNCSSNTWFSIKSGNTLIWPPRVTNSCASLDRRKNPTPAKSTLLSYVWNQTATTGRSVATGQYTVAAGKLSVPISIATPANSTNQAALKTSTTSSVTDTAVGFTYTNQTKADEFPYTGCQGSSLLLSVTNPITGAVVATQPNPPTGCPVPAKPLAAGANLTASWDQKDSSGKLVAPGTYQLHLLDGTATVIITPAP